MDLQLLENTLAARGQPRFRARQVWAWAARGASGYGEMTDLPRELRSALERELPFSTLRLERERRAADGTVKALFRTVEGHPLETVLMRYRDGRASVCVSSQSGCPLTCRFCATGAMRFARNLSASEIVDQLLHFRRAAPTAGAGRDADRDAGRDAGRDADRETDRETDREADGAQERDGGGRARHDRAAPRAPREISNVVFMGMGEPMLNLENVLAACERLPDLGIAQRRVAISTVGWIPGIERLAEHDAPVRLALSVHAAEEALRTELMPVNERYPLREVIEACHAYHARTRRRVFVEYVMLAGVNDRYEQALALARLLGGAGRPPARVFKVNLIPFNPVASNAGFAASSRASIDAFREALVRSGVPATVRLERGREIDAACGQLAARAG